MKPGRAYVSGEPAEPEDHPAFVLLDDPRRRPDVDKRGACGCDARDQQLLKHDDDLSQPSDTCL